MAGSVFITHDGVGEGAGRMLHLLRDSDGLRADLATVCRMHAQEQQATHDSLELIRKQVADTMRAPTEDPWTAYWAHETDIRNSKRTERRALSSRSRDRVRQVLRIAAIDSTRTGRNGSYRFAGLHDGPYILFGEWVSDRMAYWWWQPIQLSRTDAITQDLRTSIAAFDQFNCAFQ